MAGRDDDWTPPSAADLKIIEARQERSNQISKLMGTYMLKGYRMLDKVCDCGTILLQDREGFDYCVACNELETECAKDDPALSTEAARVAALESTHTVKAEEKSKSTTVDRIALYGATETITESSPVATMTSQEQGDRMDTEGLPTFQSSSLIEPQITSTLGELQNQLKWATTELRASLSIESSIQLCNFIKACSEALIAVNKLKKL